MRKRSIRIAGHSTSVSLEEAFWEALKELAKKQGRPLHRLIEEVDARRGSANLSSALRVYVLEERRRTSS